MMMTERELDEALAALGAELDDLCDAERLALPREDPSTRSRTRRAVLVAAGLVVVCGAVGVAVTADRDDGPSGTEPVEVATTVPSSARESQVVAFVPAEPPNGLSLDFPGAVHVRDEPSRFGQRVFGAIEDPGDPTQMIYVEYGPIQYMGPACATELSPTDDTVADPGAQSDAWMENATPLDGAVAVTIGDTTGYSCTTYGQLALGWATDGIGVRLYAGTALTADEVVAFASSLQSVPAAATGQGVPPADLTADPLPSGWVVLVGEDVPYVQRITESAYGLTYASDGSGSVPDDQEQSHVVVHTWTGVDEQGLYAKQSPIEAERVTVRGHDGYRFVSEQEGDLGPLQVDVWWDESPGVVVYASSTNYDLDELMALIDQLEPVDADGFDAFNLDQDNY